MNIRKVVEKKFKKKKEISQYIMFKDFVVKNLNVQVSAKHYINNTTLSSNIIENYLFEFKNVLDEENNV